MAAFLPGYFNQQFFYNGAVAAGQVLYVYETGTSTPKTVYTDQAGTIPYTQPIVLDANGKPENGPFWILSGECEIRQYTAPTPGGALVDTFTDVAGVAAAQDLAALSADLADDSDPAKGADLVGYKGRSVYDRLSDFASVKDAAWGAKGDGSTSDTAAIQAAMDSCAAAGKTLFFPAGRYLCGQVDIPTGLRALGEPGSEIVRVGNYGWCISVFVTGVTDVLIEGLQFDNNAPSTTGTHKWSMFMRDARRVTVRDCRFFNGLDVSIKDLGPDGLYIGSMNPTSRNDILIEDNIFDGFTRNGCSIVDGANGVTFRGNTFKNNGLTGLDIEADTGSSVQAYNITIENNRFIDNGQGSLRGTDVEPSGLSIISPAGPSSFHSDNVKITGNYFHTSAAVTNTLGIAYLKINSVKDLTVSGNTFDEPGSASAHRVVLEESTFGSQCGIVRGNLFRNVPLVNFTFDDLTIDGNTFSGAGAYVYGAASGANKRVTGNTLLSCGDATHPPISLGSQGAVICGNTIKETRASGVPAYVIGINPQFSTALNVLDWEVDDNKAESSSALFGAFVQVVGGSGSFGIQGLKARRNKIRGCAIGMEFASSGTNPDSFDIDIDGNDIEGTTGVALNMNGVARFGMRGNTVKDCASGSVAINITASERYMVESNRIVDTRSGGSRATYAIQAASTSAGSPSSMVANNLSTNTQSGFSLAAGEGTFSNNLVY